MKLCEVDINELSPMMRQYAEVKSNYKDELVFFRLGDFYELFFEDATVASSCCELTLTGKSCGLSQRVPMCGVPHHSAKGYIEKLVENGYKVAVAEQMEMNPVTKVVDRAVVSVVSRATITDFDILDNNSEVYICGVTSSGDNFILTYLDITTGSLNSLKVDKDFDVLKNEVLRLNIKEIVLSNEFDNNIFNILKDMYNIDIHISECMLDDELSFLEGFDDSVVYGVRHLYYYLSVRLLKNLEHINSVNVVDKCDYLQMDVHSIRNLELVETIRLKNREYSLLWLLDKTMSAPGSRMLKNWILNPVKSTVILNSRYDKIDVLREEFMLKTRLRDMLQKIYDLERLVGKLVNGNVNARDLLQIKCSVKYLEPIKNIVDELKFDYEFDIHDDVYELIDMSISEDAPVNIKDGGVISKGYSKELDELKDIRSGGKDFIINFEKEIKDKTGIKNLKVGYNKIFGYYIEVSKGSVKEVKDEFGFDRAQTLANAQRYTCSTLKEKESLILSAEDKIIALEGKLFKEVVDTLKRSAIALRGTAKVISEIDVIASLAEVSDLYGFVRPIYVDDLVFDVKDGRHPVVDALSKKEYVSNDILMNKDSSTLLITGPNMSGKSTYMRQSAIIVIMAQIGCFVPASSAKLSIVDKIFTRIGASDDLVNGESTFMVEMIEARNAIVNATNRSLILFDELGRGTATYDGMAIAKSILEYISNNIKCFTIFSTHYHELTSIDKEISNIKNIHVSAVENDNKITFLHKVKDGAIDKSYGIHVASLANMPKDVIKRAEEILLLYEKLSSSKEVVSNQEKKSSTVQLTMDFKDNNDDLIKRLAEIDVLKMTPRDAMNYMFELKDLLDK